MSTDVLEEHIASIFRVEEMSSERIQRASRFLDELISSTLKMEAIYSFETPVDIQQTTQRYIPEDGTLNRRIVARVVFYAVHVISKKVGD
jgi:hypothetical protein